MFELGRRRRRHGWLDYELVPSCEIGRENRQTTLNCQFGSIYDFSLLLLLLSSAPIPNWQTSIRAFVPLDFPRDGVLLVACSLLSRPDCGAFCARNISDGEHNSSRDYPHEMRQPLFMMNENPFFYRS